jgi:hypothetical protein
VPKDTHRTVATDRAELQLPEQVTVAVAELAGAVREGLLALAVGTGLQVLEAYSPRTSPGWSAPRAATTPIGRRCDTAASLAR